MPVPPNRSCRTGRTPVLEYCEPQPNKTASGRPCAYIAPTCPEIGACLNHEIDHHQCPRLKRDQVARLRPYHHNYETGARSGPFSHVWDRRQEWSELQTKSSSPDPRHGQLQSIDITANDLSTAHGTITHPKSPSWSFSEPMRHKPYSLSHFIAPAFFRLSAWPPRPWWRHWCCKFSRSRPACFQSFLYIIQL